MRLRRRLPARRWEALAWAWCAVILILCWLPRTRMPVSEAVPRAIPNLDKAVHFLMFAAFGVLWMLARRARTSPIRIALAGIVLAIVSELGQAVPFVGRDAGVWDAVADIAGVLAGVAIMAGGGATARTPRAPRKRRE